MFPVRYGLPFNVGYNSDKRKRDKRTGTWNVRSVYRAGSLTAAARELARCKLDLVGVQDVRWDKDGTVREGDYNFLLWERKRKSSIGNLWVT